MGNREKNSASEASIAGAGEGEGMAAQHRTTHTYVIDGKFYACLIENRTVPFKVSPNKIVLRDLRLFGQLLIS